MKPISNPQDKQAFKMVLNFIKAGGNINTINSMIKFCHKYEIDPAKLKEFMTKEEEAIMGKLRAANLI